MVHPATLDRGLGAALALALLPVGCLAPSSPRGARTAAVPREISAPDPNEVVARLVEAHNRERARAGLPPLEVDPQLEAAAEAHARDMAGHVQMRHRGSDGSNPFQRIEAQGYRFRRAGENVAWGQPSPESVMRDWMHSRGHRRNILGEFSQIGAAYAIGADGSPYWCVTFGDPARG
ncbi:MAG: CAP domain-containing protein [Singulisphaera sp.]|nr:CAP domain-containing protein [Singulisphaera sp.]